MRDAAGEAAEAFGFPERTVHPVPHPWGAGRIYRVDGARGPEAVLKAWTGEAGVRRLRNELRFLDELRDRGFRDAVRPLRTPTGGREHRDRGGVYWSAYGYVCGAPVERLDEPHAALVGRLLARLHEGSVNLLGGEPSDTLRAGSAHQELSVLPFAAIHGDYNVDNIIVGDSGDPTLIDFEFARRDVRLVDLASLTTVRPAGGHFRPVPLVFVRAVAAVYDENMGRHGLTAAERRFFPLAVVAHFRKIAADLRAAGSPFAMRAEEMALHFGDAGSPL